ncbi:MAG: hybrid sensor histidine kinase/response regulator [Magnetococcales bacterium]|nr:hybrid sensor histidine kinase/response regulator [Magnetococcales bacterium]
MIVKKERILVVDDIPEELHVLVEALQDSYRVTVARDGQRALELATRSPPDLVLLDILMPDPDGYEVCRRLRTMASMGDVPIIFLTGLTDMEKEIQGFAMGAVDYIHKPWSPPILKARVANHLELSRIRRTLAEQNQALVESARLREEVERMTHHDLKAPLAAVIGLPQVLLSDDNLTGEQEQHLQQIQDSGYRLLEMINRSLDLYKMEVGAYVYRPVPVDIIAIIKKIVQENRVLVRGNNLSLQILDEYGLTPDCFMIPGEEFLCHSLLTNLLKNAFEASPVGGQVTVDLRLKRGYAMIGIHNRGSVPLEIRDRIFDKFVTSGKQGGTGLGTYSAKRIAQTMGGEIALVDTEVGFTTIEVCLPSVLPSSAP